MNLRQAWPRRARRVLAASALAALMPGCFYAGAAAALSSAGGGGGGGGGGQNNTAPVAAVGSVDRQIGAVAIPYTAIDADGDPVSVQVEILQDGALLFTATDAGPGAGSDGAANIAASPDGVAHVFVWDSAADFGDLSTRTGLQARIRLDDGLGAGAPNVSAPFQINNTPTTASIDDAAFPASVTGNLVLVVNLVDADAEAVDINVRISDDNGLSFRAVPDSAIASGSRRGLLANPAGTRNSFTINLSDPALFPGRTVNQAIVEVRAVDLGGPGPIDLSRAFVVANNSPPQVSVNNNNDDAAVVAITFSAADAEATVGDAAQGLELNGQGLTGSVALAGLPPLDARLPILPGTVLIRYADGRVLRDLDQGDGGGLLVGLNGPDPSGAARIDYASGQITGPGAILVPAALPSVTADVNASFLIVTSVAYDLLSDTAGFIECSPAGAARVPFPLFVDPAAGASAAFLWDSSRDLGLGNAKPVVVRVSVSDGQDTAQAAGNSFVINNGPLSDGGLVSLAGDGNNVAFGDIDNDGDIDAVSANSLEASIAILVNNGQSLSPAQPFPLPIPRAVIGGQLQDLVASRGLSNQPDGSMSPFYLTLIDVNQDGFLDLAVANHRSPDTNPNFADAPGFFADIFIYFNNGNGGFDLQNVWGPIPSGGFGIRALQAADVNADGANDLVITARFSHDPKQTRSLAGLARAALSLEALDQSPDGGPFALAGNTLDVSPVRGGSLRILFDRAIGGQLFAIDRPLGGSLGVVLCPDPSQGFRLLPAAYIDYESGAISATAPGQPSLSGATPFNVSASAEANYEQRILTTDSLNAALFMQAPLQNGVDSLRLTGFGHRGLSLDGFGQVQSQASLPVDLSLGFGPGAGQIQTVQQLLDQLAALYSGQVLNPANDSVQAFIDPCGRIALQLSGNVEPRFVTPAELRISDSQGNPWPLFEDSHGRVTIYHVRPTPLEGGFFSPNLSAEVQSGGASLFPAPFFPADRSAVPFLSPESPSQGRATAPGPGSVALIQRLVALTEGQVVFPLALSTAAGPAPLLDGALPLLAGGPADRPSHLGSGLGPAGLGLYTGGFVPREVAVAPLFSGNPQQAQDALPDLLVSAAGDASITALTKVPAALLLAQNPALQPVFDTFDYLDGLFVAQGLALGGLINQQLAAAGQGALFIRPNGVDVSSLRLTDLDGDGLTDVQAVAGQFLVSGRNLGPAAPDPSLPFDLRLAVVGIQPGAFSVGDINEDGLADIAVPLLATRETAALVQVPPADELLATGAGQPLSLDGLRLTGLELGRAVIFPSSLEIRFQDAGGISYAFFGQGDLQAQTFTLRLVQDPDGAAIELANPAGGFDPAQGLIIGASTGAIDVVGDVRATYDQLFQTNFSQNANLVNFKAVRFPVGFLPDAAFIVDIDNDKSADVVALNRGTNNLSVLFQNRESPLDNFLSVPAGQGTTTIAQGDVIAGNGLIEVVVTNASDATVSIYIPDPVAGLKLVTTVPLFFQVPGAPGQAADGVPLPLAPGGVEVADLDGDGAADIVVVSSGIGGVGAISAAFPALPSFSGGWVIIPGLRQADLDAGASFKTSTIGLGFGSPIFLRLTDMNADGLKDIVLANTLTSQISYQLNLGGTSPFGGPRFANLAEVPALSNIVALPLDRANGDRPLIASAPNPVQLQSADLDGDGFPELVFGVGPQGPQTLGFPAVGYYRGQSPSAGAPFIVDPAAPFPGGFQTFANDISVITKSGSVSVTVGDFDQDGRPDLVVSDLFAQASVGILLNRSAGPGAPIQFAATKLPAIDQPSVSAVGDLNSDGLPDIAVPLQGSPLVAIYFNDPLNPGTFKPPLFQKAQPGLAALITDLNQDGKNDLLLSSSNANAINVFFQR